MSVALKIINNYKNGMLEVANAFIPNSTVKYIKDFIQKGSFLIDEEEVYVQLDYISNEDLDSIKYLISEAITLECEKDRHNKCTKGILDALVGLKGKIDLLSDDDKNIIISVV